MNEAIIAGAISGMILGTLPGGVVFAVLQQSIEQGWRKGVGIATGVVASDFMLILFVNLSTHGLAFVNKIRCLHQHGRSCTVADTRYREPFHQKQPAYLIPFNQGRSILSFFNRLPA